MARNLPVSSPARVATFVRNRWQAWPGIYSQNSAHTCRAYRTALRGFAAWLEHKNLELADITPAMADDYIRDQRALTLDGDTVRLRVAALSSFFSFLERRY